MSFKSDFHREEHIIVWCDLCLSHQLCVLKMSENPGNDLYNRVDPSEKIHVIAAQRQTEKKTDFKNY